MVLVVGAGFAGRMAAVRLRRAGLDVTLVDPEEASVERTRLHEAAAWGTDVRWPIAPFARRIGARFVQDRVRAVSAEGVTLAAGGSLVVDQVVLAVGSETDDRGVPGVREHALTLAGPEAAARLRERAARGGRLAVVGAGLTGLELATELAVAHPALQVVLIGSPGHLSARGEQLVRARLAELGVVHLEARVRRVDDRGLDTDGGRVDVDTVAWAAGLRAPGWLGAAGLPLDATGRIAVGPDLRVDGLPNVVAAGDCAGTPLRMACATAMPLGCHAADTVIRRARGQETRPMRFGFVLRCLSLGRGAALVQGTDAADAPTWAFAGPAAVRVKESLLWMVRRVPDWEAGSGLPLYGWRRQELDAA